VAGLALAVCAAPASARGKKSNDVVKAVAEATRPDADGNQTITLTLTVEKPYHIYANPVGNDSLDDAATVVAIEAKEKPEAVKVDYPPGEVKKDAALGDYKIYEGKVTIKAQVRRARGDSGPLAVSIKLQACDKSSCLVPGTVKLTVP
jgi:DsbC/DsbD-like thiol-disulfide interchange protein